MKHMSKIKHRSILVFVVLCFVTSSLLGTYMLHLQRARESYQKTDDHFIQTNNMKNIPYKDIIDRMRGFGSNLNDDVPTVSDKIQNRNFQGLQSEMASQSKSSPQMTNVPNIHSNNPESHSQYDGVPNTSNDAQHKTVSNRETVVESSIKKSHMISMNTQFNRIATSRENAKLKTNTETMSNKQDDTTLNKQDDTKLNKQDNTKLNKHVDTNLNKQDDTKLDKQGDTKLNEQDNTKLNKQDDKKLDKQDDTKLTYIDKSVNKQQTTERGNKIIKKSPNTYGIRRRFLNGPNYDIKFDGRGFRVNFSQDKRKDTKTNSSEKDSRKDTCVNCFKNDFKIILNQEHICNSSDIDIVIFISSAPLGFDERQTIRRTWGTKCNLNSTIKCVFVIGNNSQSLKGSQERIKNESLIYKDIVQFDFKDAYSNLTYKTLSGLKWAKQFCPSAKYVMKTDTDMYVNTYLMPYLVKKLPTSFFFGGFCWGPSIPQRDILSRWFVSYKSYRHPKFPAMCSGTGYVISMDVTYRILALSRNIPFFHLEDVYISLCVRDIGITPVNIDGFSNMQQPFEGCNYKNEVFTSHYFDPDLLNQYWRNLEYCNLTIHQDGVFRPIPLKIV